MVSGRRSSHRKRRVAVITGTRAEYGLLRTVMRAVHAAKRLQLQTVVTGTHLLSKFGRTIRQIESDGWKIAAAVPMQTGRDSRLDQARGLAKGVRGIAAFLDRAGSDIVVILGDRIEALAGALAGVTTGCVVAHIHGGDVAPGYIDDTLRHAITKLSHVHLAASQDAAERIIKMGELPADVHVVGAPGLDEIVQAVRRRKTPSDPTGEPFALFSFHPTGRSPSVEKRAARASLSALHQVGLKVIVTYPNSDPGHSGIIAALKDDSRLRIVRSFARDEYIDMLLTCGVMVGNSSSGIIESASAGVPAVNIGFRQAGRVPGGPGVINCREDKAAIVRAIRKALAMKLKPSPDPPYGDGRAGKRIAGILARTKLSDKRTPKRIAY